MLMCILHIVKGVAMLNIKIFLTFLLILLTTSLSAEAFSYQSKDVGDIDKDGVNDFAVIERFFKDNKGRISIVSGALNKILFVQEGENENDYLYNIIKAGDLNGDSYQDFFLLDKLKNQDEIGSVWAISGKTKNVIFRIFGGLKDNRFPDNISPIADFNDDGFNDFITSQDEIIYIHSGVNGEKIKTIVSKSSILEIESLMDVNNDNIKDILVLKDNSLSSSYLSELQVLSGNDLSIIWKKNISASQRYRNKFSQIGDVNRDGISDIIYSGKNVDPYILSATNGAYIKNLEVLSKGNPYFEQKINHIGDLNNDGYKDFFLSSLDLSTSSNSIKTFYRLADVGKLEFFSGKDASPIYVKTLYNYDYNDFFFCDLKSFPKATGISNKNVIITRIDENFVNDVENSIDAQILPMVSKINPKFNLKIENTRKRFKLDLAIDHFKVCNAELEISQNNNNWNNITKVSSFQVKRPTYSFTGKRPRLNLIEKDQKALYFRVKGESCKGNNKNVISNTVKLPIRKLQSKKAKRRVGFSRYTKILSRSISKLNSEYEDYYYVFNERCF